MRFGRNRDGKNRNGKREGIQDGYYYYNYGVREEIQRDGLGGEMFLDVQGCEKECVRVCFGDLGLG